MKEFKYVKEFVFYFVDSRKFLIDLKVGGDIVRILFWKDYFSDGVE